MDNSFTFYAYGNALLKSILPPPIFRDVMRRKISQKERRKKERYLRSQGIRIRR